MSEHLAALLNLDLAWQRVRADIQQGREFVRHPYEIELVQADLPAWLDKLRLEIRDGYNPRVPIIADVPKGAGAVRPGALLPIEDRVVYAASLGAAYSAIYPALEWAQGVADFSYQLVREHDRPEWFKGAFKGWDSFREKSVEKINNGAQYVIITDITGYYENIDIGKLISDLRQMGVDSETVTLISNCLNRWASVTGRGIPQGTSASDILGKVYLNNLDEELRALELDHLRYVDDIRIFCATEVDAKIALLELTRRLRRRGLNLQSAKTKILPADTAKNEIESIIPVLRAAQKEFIENIIEELGIDSDYITLEDADRFAAENPTDSSAEILREVFSRYFLEDLNNFNKTLFHYIIRRLGVQKDPYCIEYCLSILRTHPQETGSILKYIGSVGISEETIEYICNFLNSRDSIYDFQIYEIFHWLNKLDAEIPHAVQQIARRYAYDRSRPSFVRATCRQLLAINGTAADLERIEENYMHAADPLERAQILCDLRRLEAGRRNSILNRSRDDHYLCNCAANLVRRGDL